MIPLPGWLLFLIGGSLGLTLRWLGYDGWLNTITTVGLFLVAAWMMARRMEIAPEP